MNGLVQVGDSAVSFWDKKNYTWANLPSCTSPFNFNNDNDIHNNENLKMIVILSIPYAQFLLRSKDY